MSTRVDVLSPIGFLLFLIAVGLSIASLVVRFRRSRGLERAQLKWFVFAAVLTILFGVGASVAATTAWLQALGYVAIAVIPVACLVSIMRYRLYDIDRLISRTVAYFAVSAVLVGVYAAIVVGVGALTGRTDSPVLIAGATLAVAALVRPLLRAVKSVVDRRFARRRYDAQRALEEFSARMRDEVDLEQVRAHLLGTVRDTMQPAFAGLWLRAEAAQ
jgi:small-conductance mechanosensitive channel